MKWFIYSIKRNFRIVAFSFLMAGLFLIFAPQAAAQNYNIEFWADRTHIRTGDCVNIYWDTDNVRTVYYNNRPVSGISQSRVECPTHSTTYKLLVTTRDGQQIHKQINVHVSESPFYRGSWNNDLTIEFWTDQSHIRAGECVNIYWHTNNVKAVYYDNQPVSGINQRRVACPDQTTTYSLLVITPDNLQLLRQVTVQVSGQASDRGSPDMDPGQMIDFDKEGRISENEDDFRWIWANGEHGIIEKANNDPDLQLARVERGDDDRFDRLSEDECEELLEDEDHSRLELTEKLIVCIRTDAGDYGRFRVTDIRSDDGRLEIDWLVWD